jgi:ABC-type Fe3+-citrate transport system substrate-binding protein
MKKRLAEKGKEIENLKNKLKELKECIIDSRDKYMKLTEHEDFTTATISFGAYNLLNSFIEIINAPDTNVGTMED